jgi:hypothetical protein
VSTNQSFNHLLGRGCALAGAAQQGFKFNSLLCNRAVRTRSETQNKECQTKPKCLPINHSTTYLGVVVLLLEKLSMVSTACCATGQDAPGVKPKTKSTKPNQSTVSTNQSFIHLLGRGCALAGAAQQGFNSLLCNRTVRTRSETQNKEYQTKPKYSIYQSIIHPPTWAWLCSCWNCSAGFQQLAVQLDAPE